MAIGKRFGQRLGDSLAHEFDDEYRLFGRLARFDPTAPPVAWEEQHTAAEQATPKDWPVPRRASCDYLRIDTDFRNFYFV